MLGVFAKSSRLLIRMMLTIVRLWIVRMMAYPGRRDVNDLQNPNTEHGHHANLPPERHFEFVYLSEWKNEHPHVQADINSDVREYNIL